MKGDRNMSGWIYNASLFAKKQRNLNSSRHRNVLFYPAKQDGFMVQQKNQGTWNQRTKGPLTSSVTLARTSSLWAFPLTVNEQMRPNDLFATFQHKPWVCESTFKVKTTGNVPSWYINQQSQAAAVQTNAPWHITQPRNEARTQRWTGRNAGIHGAQSHWGDLSTVWVIQRALSSTMGYDTGGSGYREYEHF